MLKSVLYYWLLITTTARFVDIIYLLAKDNMNLPIPVIAVTAAMILYGIFLLVKKYVGNIHLKHLMLFHMVQTVTIVFNLIYVAVACPLQISVAEIFIVGTFLDILINCGIVYLCAKHMRSNYFAIAQPAAPSHRRV